MEKKLHLLLLGVFAIMGTYKIANAGFTYGAYVERFNIVDDCTLKSNVVATGTQQNAIAVWGNYVYVVYYNTANNVCISRNTQWGSGSWKTVVLPVKYTTRTTSDGSVIWDSHNTPNIAISPNDGRIHIAYNMHAAPMRYVISEPGAAWVDDWQFTSSQFQSVRHSLEYNGPTIYDVTYPRFILGNNNNLFMMYRVGGSGNGDTYWTKYNDNGYWNTPTLLIDGRSSNAGTYAGDNNRCAYFNEVQFKSGKIYLTWCWRENPDPDSNHDLMFAYSGNGGVSWKNSSGQTLSLPIRLTSPVKVVDIKPGSWNWDYINHNGCAVDGNGNVHTLLRIDGGWYYHCKGIKDYWGNYSWSTSWAFYMGGDRPKLYCDRTTNTLYAVIRNHGGDLALWGAKSSTNWTDWTHLNTESTGTYTSTCNSYMYWDGNLMLTAAVGSDHSLSCIRWWTSYVKSAEVEDDDSMSDLSDELELSPNPTDGPFNVKMNIEGASVLSIYDMSGKRLYHATQYESNYKVQPNLESGLYLVKIKDKENKEHTRKLLVK